MDSEAPSGGPQDLEVVCPECEGVGYFTEMGREYACHECEGAGHLPTEAGRKILDLVRHHFKPMLRRATGR